MFCLFTMTVLLANASLFTAVTPRSDWLMHPMPWIHIRRATEAFQNETLYVCVCVCVCVCVYLQNKSLKV
jgi:hypothetical protein